MAGQNPGSPTEFQYFYEDEVFKINKRGQVVFGLVMENFEANSSEEDTDDDSPVKKGEIRVVWHPSGIERVISPSVGLADRSLMPGDVVRRMIKGKDTQRGYCRDIVVSAAVQVVGTNLVLPAVSSERLQLLEEFTTDLAVCLDSWVGTSKIVHSKMRLVSGDGSRIEFPDINNCFLEDYVQRRRRGPRVSSSTGYLNAPDFYPGQVVTGPLGILDEATWLHTTKEMKAARKHKTREHKFTVESVETESVGVQWQCRALGAGPPQQPRYLVEGEDLKRLKLLNLFEPCTLQLGARNFLTVTEGDVFCTKGHWKKTQSKIYRAIRRQMKPAKSRDIRENCGKDGSTQTQDSNASNKVTFRISCKCKKRLSIHKEGKTSFVHNNQTHPNQFENRSHSCTKDSTGEVKKDDKNSQSKMEVDIVIVDSDVTNTDGHLDVDTDIVSALDIKDINKPSISPQPSEEATKLDVPDLVLNGKSTSDGSSTPEISGTPEKHRKLRKSRISPSNNSSNDNLTVVNGEHKTLCSNRNDHEDSDNWDSSDDGTNSDSCATWSSHCSSSPNNSWRGRRLPQLVTKFLKGKRLKRSAQRETTTAKPRPGDRVVVETLSTTSKANVVWQDGTIELGIPSKELYPIHHLDGQECFPGDFVISGNGSPSLRDYGVVQKVDHHGRTAVVKWFRTYTSCQEPVPQLVSESEVSVYDLKDHPDFQYRPGTVVIRVANFTGSEATCTAGQVIDNFPTGRVNVWWVDGHTSMCWPQDLFKVGEYDSDEGDLWAEDGTGSEDSWETQYSGGSGDRGARDSREKDILDRERSADAETFLIAEGINIDNTGIGDYPKVPRCLEPRAAAHIERGRAAMAKLEEMFSKNPALQNQEIMRKLLNLYKDCRFLDRLLGTSFFHEDHFQGLLERVRERGGGKEATPPGTAGSRRVHNQVMRLFSNDETDEQIAKDSSTVDTHNMSSSKSQTLDKAPDVANLEINKLGLVGDHFEKVLCSIEVVNCSNESNVITSSHDVCKSSVSTDIDIDCGKDIYKNTTLDGDFNLKEPTQDARFHSSSSEGSLSKYLTPVGSVTDLTLPSQGEKSPINNALNKIMANEDSGLDSQSLSISANNTSNGDYETSLHSSDMTKPDYCTNRSTLKVYHNNPVSSSPETVLSTRNVCQKLCSLINIQMMKACAEISRQYDALVVTIADDKSIMKEDNKDNTAGQMDVTENIINDSDPTGSAKISELSALKDILKNVTASPCVECTGEELGEGFCVLESAPATHHFRLSLLQPSEPRLFQQAVRRELKLLRSDLPQGVWVRGYEDRMDLLSIMIAGPAKTPYEDGLFLFDVQLGGEFPRAPPMCHYISYCSDRLNPNLYEDGKVCVSLLGTWSGRGVEVWGKDSSLLQVIVSLQGLILCAEPYFNEAGYDKQKGSQQGSENSRMYNEMVLLKLVQSLTKQLGNPPEVFREEILSFQSRHASGLCNRLERWMLMSEEYVMLHPDSPLTSECFFSTMHNLDPPAPDYPLLPVSRGFCLTLRSSLEAYRVALRQASINVDINL